MAGTRANWVRIPLSGEVFDFPDYAYPVVSFLDYYNALRRVIVDLSLTMSGVDSTWYQWVADNGMIARLVTTPTLDDPPPRISSGISGTFSQQYLWTQAFAGEVFQPLENPAIHAIKYPRDGMVHGDVAGQRRPELGTTAVLWIQWGWMNQDLTTHFSDITHTRMAGQVSALIEYLGP